MKHKCGGFILSLSFSFERNRGKVSGGVHIILNLQVRGS